MPAPNLMQLIDICNIFAFFSDIKSENGRQSVNIYKSQKNDGENITGFIPYIVISKIS